MALSSASNEVESRNDVSAGSYSPKISAIPGPLPGSVAANQLTPGVKSTSQPAARSVAAIPAMRSGAWVGDGSVAESAPIKPDAILGVNLTLMLLGERAHVNPDESPVLFLC